MGNLNNVREGHGVSILQDEFIIVGGRVSGPTFLNFSELFSRPWILCFIAQIEVLDKLVQKSKEKIDFDHRGVKEWSRSFLLLTYKKHKSATFQNKIEKQRSFSHYSESIYGKSFTP